MNKNFALTTAIELAKVALNSIEIKFIPDENCGNALADFIETLAERLEKMNTES